MVRGSKNKNEGEEDPQRKRLKSLAFSNKLVSEIPARPQAPLRPSNAVVKQHGKDIVKKSQRKNRFLFSFPGLFAPISGGKFGDLKDLGTKSPILYLDFPQGRMKLFGSIVFPKNKYLTLQFPRGGKSVMCEDYFDNMIVFSEAWWIGTKEENRDEIQLDFPKQLTEGCNKDYDFKGGKGSSAVVSNQRDHKNDKHSPDAKLEHDLSDVVEVTPVRQSARTAGKQFNGGNLNIVNEGAVEGAQIPEQNQESSGSEAKLKKQSKSASVTISKKDSHSNHGPLVQATISTLFKKVEKKKVGSSLPSQVQTPSEALKTPRTPRKPASPKDSGKKSLQAPSKRKVEQDGGPSKKGKSTTENDAVGKRLAKKKKIEVEDDIDEISSSSQDADCSDEDWAA